MWEIYCIEKVFFILFSHAEIWERIINLYSWNNILDKSLGMNEGRKVGLVWEQISRKSQGLAGTWINCTNADLGERNYFFSLVGIRSKHRARSKSWKLILYDSGWAVKRRIKKKKKKRIYWNEQDEQRHFIERIWSFYGWLTLRIANWISRRKIQCFQSEYYFFLSYGF